MAIPFFTTIRLFSEFLQSLVSDCRDGGQRPDGIMQYMVVFRAYFKGRRKDSVTACDFYRNSPVLCGTYYCAWCTME